MAALLGLGQSYIRLGNARLSTRYIDVRPRPRAGGWRRLQLFTNGHLSVEVIDVYLPKCMIRRRVAQLGAVGSVRYRGSNHGKLEAVSAGLLGMGGATEFVISHSCAGWRGGGLPSCWRVRKTYFKGVANALA